MITENIKNVDLIIEILDARIPFSSKNPEIARLTESKPRVILLNKASLADPAQSDKWRAKYTGDGCECILTDCVNGGGLDKLMPAINKLMEEKLQRYSDKGMTGRKLKAMGLGIPNVGKSSLINRLCGNKKAKVEDRPGVTLNKQWVPTNLGIDLLDMPGVLWPKFDDQTVGENLAMTGAIKDAVVNVEEIAMFLCGRLRRLYPEALAARYKLSSDMSEYDDLSDWDLVELIGRKRGFLISGGEVNTERTALMLLDEFRGGVIGRITLDRI
jgi:ribosome biogenesis GTPase A